MENASLSPLYIEERDFGHGQARRSSPGGGGAPRPLAQKDEGGTVAL